MSKIHSFDFEYDHDYSLIGIHSILEDFRIAFFINKNLDIHLMRNKDDLDFPPRNCNFSLFVYEDKAKFTSWSLICNKYSSLTNLSGDINNLFHQETQISYLIPEKKQLDYFIKINGNYNALEMQNILNRINSIPNVMTSYSIDPYDLKSRDYLIF